MSNHQVEANQEPEDQEATKSATSNPEPEGSDKPAAEPERTAQAIKHEPDK